MSRIRSRGRTRINSIIPGGSPGNRDTTVDGYQVHWITVADSIYNGTGTADITIPTGILYLWDGVGLTEITSQNICNGVVSGSPWKVYAVEYVANNPGKKVVIVQNAKGGSNLGPDGVDNDYWGVGGLREASDGAVDACLAFLQLDKPIVILCDAIINDIRVPQTIQTITGYFDDNINHLTGKFPTTPILYNIPGRNGTTSNTLLIKQCRDLIKQRSLTVPMLFIGAQTCSYESLSYYQGDALHPIKAGSEQLGISNARWHSNSSYSKYARSIMSMQFGTLTTNQKDLLATELDTIGNNIYNGYECYFPAVVNDDRDRFLDWALLTSPVNAGSTCTVGQYCTSNGTTYMRTAYVPSTLSLFVTQNDECIGVYIKTMRSDASTLRVAFGASDTSRHMVIGQTTTGVFYRIGDNTLTVYATEAELQDNSEYVALRDSGTSKALNKNGVEVHRATVSALGLVQQSPTVGLLNQNGSPASGVDMDYANLFIATASAYNSNKVNTFNARKARIDNWNL